MLCDQCDFVVVDYSHEFLGAEFQPCLVLVGWDEVQGTRSSIEVYRSYRWHKLIDAEHRGYLDSLIRDWTSVGGGEIHEIIEQLQRLVVGPIRMGDCGRTDRAGLNSLLERILGISTTR